MAVVRPFHGIRYNPALIGDLSEVICPPYDIISLAQQQSYYQRSKYNYIRIEYPRELPADSQNDNKYTRALSVFEKWLSEGVLVQEKDPAIYLHSHHFRLHGEPCCRRSLVAAVGVEDWSTQTVRPHEGTLQKAKSDREALLRTLKANTSPVLVMFEDDQATMASLFDSLTVNPPHISCGGYDDESHELWVVSEPRAVDAIAGMFNRRPLYIADGHHRYESALQYRRQQEALLGRTTGQEPFNYIMMEMVAFDDPGLVILPPHRIVRGVNRQNIRGLLPRLKELFDIEEFQLENTGDWKNIDRFMRTHTTCLALFGLGGNRIHVLTVTDHSRLDRMMPAFHSELYKRLDVSIVDHIILESLLGLSDMSDLSRIAFDHNREAVIDRVRAGEYQLALILKPVDPGTIRTVADAGERMPRKSTYFYPKSPSGLVLKRLE